MIRPKMVEIVHHKRLTDYIFIKSVFQFFISSRKEIRILSERDFFLIIESVFKLTNYKMIIVVQSRDEQKKKN